MSNYDGQRHPGPWRVMSGDVEFAGFIVAIGFTYVYDNLNRLSDADQLADRAVRIRL